MKCSRTVCENHVAICTHTQDGRKYCVPCARKINDAHRHITPPLVTIPSMEERQAAVAAYNAEIDLRAEVSEAIDLASASACRIVSTCRYRY